MAPSSESPSRPPHSPPNERVASGHSAIDRAPPAQYADPRSHFDRRRNGVQWTKFANSFKNRHRASRSGEISEKPKIQIARIPILVKVVKREITYMKHIYTACIGLVLSTLLTPTAFAQNAFNQWRFGQGAGLDFNSGSPVAVSGTMIYTNEGSASIADAATGDLLFYTDGVAVFDTTNTQMPNGFGLSGDVTTTQAALIVKQPAHDSLYYVFTIPADAAGMTDLRYSVVNMNLNGGLGDVAAKNLFMADGDTISEKATAIRHCNGKDWWIIFHAIGNNHYLSWKLDSTGLSSTPVVSGAGTVLTTAQNAGLGWLSTSNDATRLVNPSYSLGTVDIVTFHNDSGTVSNPILLTGFTKAYGTAFSPNDQVLYVTDNMSLAQFDLTSGVAATIMSSRIDIVTEANMMRAIRLGPDGKMYIAREWEGHLGLVNFPNTLGFGCTYNPLGVNLSPGSNSLGLPNTYSFALANPCDPPVAAPDPDAVAGLALTSVYPMPFESSFMVDLHADTEGNVAVQVLDLQGRLLYATSHAVQAGQNHFRIDAGELSAGIYLLRVQDGETVLVKRIPRM
jgi:hypothetical protein